MKKNCNFATSYKYKFLWLQKYNYPSWFLVTSNLVVRPRQVSCSWFVLFPRNVKQTWEITSCTNSTKMAFRFPRVADGKVMRGINWVLSRNVAPMTRLVDWNAQMYHSQRRYEVMVKFVLSYEEILYLYNICTRLRSNILLSSKTVRYSMQCTISRTI